MITPRLLNDIQSLIADSANIKVRTKIEFRVSFC